MCFLCLCFCNGQSIFVLFLVKKRSSVHLETGEFSLVHLADFLNLFQAKITCIR